MVVLSGDHIYRMDYGDLLQFHAGHKGCMTLSAAVVPREGAGEFGMERGTRLRAGGGSGTGQMGQDGRWVQRSAHSPDGV